MPDQKPIRSALISVFHKEGLEPIIQELQKLGVNLYSTGGTQKFIDDLGIAVTPVEAVTSYPSILGGRVKTLHPKIFGGILSRRDHDGDIQEMADFEIPGIDLVIVDLYPFEETVQAGKSQQDIIEKIDIGGIALIRAAAKNFKDVLIVSSRSQYEGFLHLLEVQNGNTTLADRKAYARYAFQTSSHYDTHIWQWFAADDQEGQPQAFKQSIQQTRLLRYGENPHQKGYFHGDLEDMFEQLHGKALSYNNLVDVDAAVNIVQEFDKPVFAILKHTNACGLAQRDDITEAWKAALAGDPVSAFGGIVCTNQIIDESTAREINEVFIEVVIAPGFSKEALEILRSKKNRIILIQRHAHMPNTIFKSLLNGVIEQDRDRSAEGENSFNTVTEKSPTPQQIADLEFAVIAAKHLKSNTIALVKNRQIIGIGTGQTSRVDACRQAIAKAHHFNFDLQDAVMASDAFFPFPDCVEIAAEAGITAVVQPGGSIRDQDSIDACNRLGMAMVTTGVRHFKH